MAVTDVPSAGEVLTADSATAASWQAAAGGGIPATILDAKGDLIAASAADTAARVAVGANGKSLGADSSQATGVAWQDKPRPQGGTNANLVLASTLPRFIALNATTTLTSGTLYLVGITLAAGIPLASITVVSANVALGVGTHQIFGIFDDSLGTSSATAYALLAQTADDTSTAWAANTAKTLALTATFTPGRSGYFYLGILVEATTPPNLRAIAGDSITCAIASINSGNSDAGLTALPNPAVAPTLGGASIASAWVK